MVFSEMVAEVEPPPFAGNQGPVTDGEQPPLGDEAAGQRRKSKATFLKRRHSA
jgi:hypothetical protein